VRVRPFTGRRIVAGRIGGAYSPPVAGGSGPAFRASSTAASASGSITVSAPTGTSSGDQLILVYRSFYDTKSGAAGSLSSTGWTLVTAPTTYAGIGFAVYRKTAGASETSYVWNSGSNWTTGNLSVIAVSGASAMDVTGTLSSNLTAPSVTTTTTSDVLVYVGSESTYAPATPSGMTSRVSYANPAGVKIATQTLTASGGTGSRDGTIGFPASAYSILLAVK